MSKGVYIIQCPPSWIKLAPLSLVYLENYLKDKKFGIKVRDLNIELFQLLKLPQNEWLALNDSFEKGLFEYIRKNFPSFLDMLYEDVKNYDYIGLSILKRNSHFSFSLARKLKEIFPLKKIIIGGPETFHLSLKNKLDNKYSWVIGEGELALLKILNERSTEIQSFEEIENLDTLPFLNFDCLGMDNYSKSIPLLSSRGCKFGCNFCSERKLYKKFRQHSPRYMSDLIKYLSDKHNINTFIFCDSLINYSNAWIEEFCRNLLKNCPKVKWEAQMRVDKDFNPNLGSLMKESGCYNLFIGLESASDNVLQKMNKGFSSETALIFFKKLRESSLQFEISLIFGYPGENESDFNDTLNFVVKNRKIIPKIAQVNPFVDYFSNSNNLSVSAEAKSRISRFLQVLEKEKIRYTKSFINNLVY